MKLRTRLSRVTSSPTFWVRMHMGATFMWALLMVPSVLWWRESLVWVIIMSCYANFVGSMASLQSARADRNSPSLEDVVRLEQKIDAMRKRINLLATRTR